MLDSYAKKVGSRIRSLREARGLSQEDLASAAGLQPVSVSRWERGVAEVSIGSLARVCTVLDLSLAGFFSSVEEGRVLPKRKPAAAQPVLDLLRGRDPRQIRWAEGVLRAALKDWGRGK